MRNYWMYCFVDGKSRAGINWTGMDCRGMIWRGGPLTIGGG